MHLSVGLEWLLVASVSVLYKQIVSRRSSIAQVSTTPAATPTTNTTHSSSIHADEHNVRMLLLLLPPSDTQEPYAE